MKATLEELSWLLAKIHKTIIEHQFSELEKKHGQKLATGTRLQLLLNGPEFAWLRPLSGLMTEIDGLIFQKEPIGALQFQDVQEKFTDLFIKKTNQSFTPEFEKLEKVLPSLKTELDTAKKSVYQQ